MFADEDLPRHAAENLDQADALLFGRVTYEMMEGGDFGNKIQQARGSESGDSIIPKKVNCADAANMVTSY